MISFLISLVLLASPPTPSTALAGQEKAAQNTNPDNRPEVKKLIDELDLHVKKDGKEDSDAVGTIDKLHIEFPKCGPKDRAAVVEALNKVFTARRLEDKTGVRENKIFIAAAVSMRDMAPESPKILMSWINQKDHRKDLALQEKLVQSLGKTKDEEGRKFLLKLLTDKSPRVLAAASEALGEFGEADQKIRKEVFEALLKLLMESKAAADAGSAQQKPDPISSERWNAIAAPIITSLQALSKHEENDPQKWQTWWNKNKKADWPQKSS